MVALKYDMKAYLRMLLNTPSLRRVSAKEVSPGAPCYFQGPVFRRMTAEQVWDSLVALVNPQPDGSQLDAPASVSKRELDGRTTWPTCSLTRRRHRCSSKPPSKSPRPCRIRTAAFDALRKELDAARAKDDKETRQGRAGVKLGDSQRVLRQTVSRCFYEAASKIRQRSREGQSRR